MGAGLADPWFVRRFLTIVPGPSRDGSLSLHGFPFDSRALSGVA